MEIDATLLRLCILAVFGLTALLDLRYRRAPNAAWVAIVGLGGAALWIEGVRLGQLVSITLVTIAVAAVAMYAFDRQWIPGGADAKAAMVIPIAFPRMPGHRVWSGSVGTLLQGFEVVMLVCIVAGLVGWVMTHLARRSESERGVPFLVAIFAGVGALFVA